MRWFWALLILSGTGLAQPYLHYAAPVGTSMVYSTFYGARAVPIEYFWPSSLPQPPRRYNLDIWPEGYVQEWRRVVAPGVEEVTRWEPLGYCLITSIFLSRYMAAERSSDVPMVYEASSQGKGGEVSPGCLAPPSPRSSSEILPAYQVPLEVGQRLQVEVAAPWPVGAKGQLNLIYLGQQEGVHRFSIRLQVPAQRVGELWVGTLAYQGEALYLLDGRLLSEKLYAKGVVFRLGATSGAFRVYLSREVNGQEEPSDAPPLVIRP
ncbi:hypothetical protein Mesil_2273 [Allomeiothermus silvanus DSM 9946]|uniref:Uncharacterized protein n=1 Tax=Allomeiothermus silvanus (strain ATCC 700542 / DSM 9946 / NBRC 106475 / NCIMB 13440 / VI-R2) TaxID=526227 RepID=D7BIG4_ALLS1|nr:hypothetical protein [Allomeiothermus silvanus]ADH64139.1 hypothetical protein Mesil_2273 [Allomeiothermus silvanus DSM 9946]